eukprot:COSAG02_NODE_29148_length_575_cov_0.754202_1_plen_101_part_01
MVWLHVCLLACLANLKLLGAEFESISQGQCERLRASVEQGLLDASWVQDAVRSTCGIGSEALAVSRSRLDFKSRGTSANSKDGVTLRRATQSVPQSECPAG